MQQHPERRKLVKHAVQAGFARELTFSCYRRFPLLNADTHKSELATAIDRAVSNHGFDLTAYVFMPEHVHLIVFSRQDGASISALLAAIKRPTSFRIKQHMLDCNDPWLSRIVIRERPGKTTFRLWQEGSGYDRSVNDRQTLQNAIDYIHANPVRRGFVESPQDWRWSSWHAYHATDLRPQSPRVHGMPEADLLT